MSEQPLIGDHRGHKLSPSEIEGLDALWARHWTPPQVAQRLAGVDAPWCVAAGWALELFCGAPTRRHSDLEIAVPAAAFPQIRARFDEYVFDAVSSGCLWYDAAPEVLAATHQTWLRDPASGDYLFDVFREPHDGDTWICRHNPAIRLPYADIILRTADGIPFLAPELVLLFKAKNVRPKDQADFETALPHLSPGRRATLADLIVRGYPEHQWLAAL